MWGNGELPGDLVPGPKKWNISFLLKLLLFFAACGETANYLLIWYLDLTNQVFQFIFFLAACEETANYLVIWCLDLEMEEKHELMQHVAHQVRVPDPRSQLECSGSKPRQGFGSPEPVWVFRIRINCYVLDSICLSCCISETLFFLIFQTF